jgi:hypothetical protein
MARLKATGVKLHLVENASFGHGGLNDSGYSSGVLRDGGGIGAVGARSLMLSRLSRAANPSYITRKWGHYGMHYDKWGWVRVL